MKPQKYGESKMSMATLTLEERKSAVLERIIVALRAKLDPLSPEELETIAKHLERIGSTPAIEPEKGELIRGISKGSTITERERIDLEIRALSEYFTFRRQLLEGSLTSSQVADMLGTSRQTPHDRMKSGSLLAVLDRGVWRFPAWQFDPSGPDGVIPGLPNVIRTLKLSPLAKMSWLQRANPVLDGLTPLDALTRGEIERVLEEARGVGTER
jgi:hypothetical protein